MRVRLRDKYFKLTFERLPKTHDGACCMSTREIKVRTSLRGERRLEVVIHELLHGCHWDLDEAAIEETAEDLARVLWRLGYRETEIGSLDG
jgi:hypothetical protein